MRPMLDDQEREHDDKHSRHQEPTASATRRPVIAMADDVFHRRTAQHAPIPALDDISGGQRAGVQLESQSPGQVRAEDAVRVDLGPQPPEVVKPWVHSAHQPGRDARVLGQVEPPAGAGHHFVELAE